MDAIRTELEEKLQELLTQASAVAAELQAVDQGDETPHFGPSGIARPRSGSAIKSDDSDYQGS